MGTHDLEVEISDSPSIEVNSELGLQKSDNRVICYKRGFKGSSNYRPGVWTMRDLYNYSACNGYASGLYNLAWAQAVQNKSLDDVIVMIPDEKSKRLASVVTTADDKEYRDNDDVVNEVINVDSSDTEGNNAFIDDELEEGEIDMDAELNDEAQDISRCSSKDEIIIGSPETFSQMGALNLPHFLIPETQDKLTVEEAKKSFQDICSHLLNVLISLNEVRSMDNIEIMDSHLERLFSSILTLEYAFIEMREPEQDANKCIFYRLLTSIIDQIPPLFTPKQIEEIEVIRHSLDAFSKGTPRPNCEDELNDTTPEDTSASDMSIEDISSDFSCFDTSNSNSTLVGQNTVSESSEALVSSIKRKGFPGLLVDLHKAHDADSLPSPTREKPPNSSILSTSTIGTKLFSLDSENLSFMSSKPQKSVLPPYETDALEAVSTYQQKFGRTSLLEDRLPSPTPSDQGDVGGRDIGGDVSSSYSGANGSVSVNNINIGASDVTTKREESTSPWNVLKAKSLPSRDPRLRDTGLSQNTSDSNNKSVHLLNNAVEIGSHREIVVSRSLSDEPPIKRQRNSSENYSWRTTGKNEVEPMRTEMKALPQIDLRSANNGMMVVDERMACKEDNLVSCLSTLLKDIDPALLMKLLHMGQQKLSTEPVVTQSFQHTPNTTVGSLAFSQEPPTKQVELGTIRMKPRDPRRVLHSNTSCITSITSIQDSKSNLNPENPTNIISTPSISAPTSECSQFMQNLRGTTGLLSTSHHSKVYIPPQPVMVGGERMGVRADCTDKKNASCLASERTPTHNGWNGVEHLLDGYDDDQKATIQRERVRRLDEQRRMFASRKLSLVLDLDHTLLNSAKFVEVDPVHEEILRKKEEQDRESSERHLYRFVHMGMWTKLRPGIWNFLEKASKSYELHLYTMGNKLYATEMAKILDPNGTLFGGRVLSRGDDGDPFNGEERAPKTKDLDGVLGMESSVLIVDDSVRVWPHNKLNLIVVERYTYFPCSRRQFGLVGPSLLEIGHDERPEDGTLSSSLVVIERIHRNFFSHMRLEDMDVRNILATEQQKILTGCRIVFSRVFPIGEAKPHLHPLWQTAEQFGASCTNQIDERVTHVVANSLGTDKVNWAISTGRYVVHPGWVEASALLYRRANEFNFSIKS